MLGDRLLGLTSQLVELFSELDPAELTGEELTEQMLIYLDGVKDPIQAGGEPAFVTRRVGLFLSECMSAALRRDRRGEEVPHEHAAILDATYQKIQSTKTGVAGDTPSVDQLENMESTAKKQMQQFVMQAGLVKKVPTEASDQKIVLSG